MVDKSFLQTEYHLTANPFFDTSYGPKMVDRTDLKKDLYGILNGFLDIDAPQMLFISGYYGLGKTFTLLEIDKDIRNRKAQYIRAEKLLSCYIRIIPAKAPTDYFLYVYTEIMNALGFHTLKNLFEEFQKLSKENKDVTNISVDFRNAFSRIGTEYSNLVWDYFKGSNNISSSQLKDLGVSGKIDSEKIAKIILADLLRFMKILDYKALVVLVDEFENIFTLTGKSKSASILVTFREIYDLINKETYEGSKICKTIFIFASSSSTSEDLKELIQDIGPGGVKPFLDRLISTPFDLEPFKKKYVRELLEIKLEKYRESKHKESTDKIFPFEEDFIDYILEISGGNPRYILQYTATIVDSASDKGYKKIGKKEAELIVNEKNIL